ncbi:probable 39S ribosomal protein L24, mitochondrial [Homarus americanus]|uniref:Large ribosomal subunit protein uL24m n=1 Tax=Homarus americanus TaxID=6706 RepID=A0A8J5TV01_HOMAM|nr:probable 39S ribosomal protein L24, mitochondrial [Homarus americanus]KAG7177602.1 39S ribosomal protein L24-like [Homarus americanus]
MPRITEILKCVSDMTKQSSNLPEAYIKRAMEQVEWRTPKAIQYRQTEIKRKKFRFTTNRPWTQQFEKQNQPGLRRKKVFVEPILEWTFFKGDRVEILEGKDKGKQGLVNYIIQERNWVMVEGLNCHYRTIGKKKNYPGMMVKSEAPLLVTTQVGLIDPSDNKPTQAEWRYTEEGDKVRVSVRSGRLIPLPKLAEETQDYKTKSTYIEQEKDTPAEELTRITFEPQLKTFAMDIADKMGIKEDRIPRKTYWY